jgi:hypothetical protein
MKTSQWLIGLILVMNVLLVGVIYYTQVIDKPSASEIPNLVGTWKGPNVTVSDQKGYKEWPEKIVEITEQKDRRFRGTFTYPDGTKHFFGVIYPDNKTFTWVSTPSKGYVHGLIFEADKIAACYVEAWEQASAGCATLNRSTK